MGISDIRLIVNRILPEDFKLLNATVDDVIDLVGAQLIGIVREDKTVMLALHDNIPLVLHRKRYAAYDFLDIARRIRGEDIPLRRFKRARLPKR
jgi:septum site-determining protein MinD